MFERSENENRINPHHKESNNEIATRSDIIYLHTIIATTILAPKLCLFKPSYSTKLCSDPDYVCIKTKNGDTWNKLFPNASEQNLLRRLNRINIELHPGVVLAIPNNLGQLDITHFSPFAARIDPQYRTTIVLDLNDQAFAAYDTSGSLLRWGPISAGNDWCPDVHRGCHTPQGVYTVNSKGGPGCISSKYPIPRGGAPMPYCMYFRGGYALHGSFLPGYNASHGCVRLFYDDAQWLNQQFVEVGRTKVIVRS